MRMLLTKTRRRKPLPTERIGGGALRAGGAFSPVAIATGRIP